MNIVGCDFHPSAQQIAFLDNTTGEIVQKKLQHSNGEAERFYSKLPKPTRIGIEATGNSQWFIDLLLRLGHEVWIGDAAKIRASYIRKQKTDKRDAEHLLTLLLQNRFPRLWTPDRQTRNLRQLLIHRHKLVEIRTRVKNSLHHLAMNRGVQLKEKLFSKMGQEIFDALELDEWASVRRTDLDTLLRLLDQQIGKLDQAVELAAKQSPQAKLLMTQPGIGPITAMAYVLTIGDVSRFPNGRKVASYLGLIPSEISSNNKRINGPITKQGNRFLRLLLVEAAQTAVRCDPGLRKKYLHRRHSKATGTAKVAAAHKLATRLYWMMRTNMAYPEIVLIESNPRVPLVD